MQPHQRKARRSPRSRTPTIEDPEAKRLYAAILKRPGTTLTDLVAQLGMGWSTVYAKLALLEGAGLVVAKRQGRHRLCWPIDQAPSRGAGKRVVMLQGATARAIGARIAQKRGQTPEEIALHLGLSPRVVYHHLGRFRAAGLIEVAKQTRYGRVRPTPLLKEALAAVRRSRTPRPQAAEQLAGGEGVAA